MINEKHVDSALSLLKKTSSELREVDELTREILDCLKLNDNVTLRMLLSMRREHINNLVQYEQAVNKMCDIMDKNDSSDFKNILTAKSCNIQVASELFLQAKKNRLLLDSVIAADKVLSQRFTNDKSFYSLSSKL